jgi:hypothetical protein
MKKLILAGVLAMVGLGGCATSGGGVWACASKSNVLMGPCKRPDLADCVPNYHAVDQCRAQGNWGCYAAPARLAMRLDPTLGSCTYQPGTQQWVYRQF